MCVFSPPSPPKDNSAELARQREDKRVADIRAGRGSIDEAFARFDDPYFAGVTDDYQDFYFPQVDQQYQDARRKLTLGLARSGNLNAGAGARQIGDLTEKYNTQRQGFASRALDDTNRYRQQIDAAKGDLFQQNAAAADPAAIAVDAASRAGTFAAPPSASPIGALFNDFLSTSLPIGVAAEARGLPGFRTGLFKPSKSETIVN